MTKVLSDQGGRTRKKKVFTQPLTAEEFKMLVTVSKDPFEFAKHIKVIHPVRGKVPFDLFGYQKAVLRDFLLHRFNIIKKFRQAGLTELIAMFCLWFAMYHPAKTINIISIKDSVAKKVLRRIKFMYRNLPECLKVPVVNGRPGELGTASEMEFANNSMITSIPTTDQAGRSEALSLLVIDETAIIRWADQIWAAAFATLSTGGRAILNSTPYGVGNFFHKRWVEACSEGGLFNPINLRWQMHPERNMDWYNIMSKALGPRRTAQEIDGDFLASGNNVFDLVDIKAIEDNLYDYMPIDYRGESLFNPIFKGIRSLGDSLKVYDLPKRERRYTIGGDIASGRSRDYSAFSIMDEFGEEAASFKMRIPINEFAHLMARFGTIYNHALLAPESNDVGLGVATKLQEDGYPNLYYAVKLLKEKGDRRPKEEKIPGWYTTRKNRPVIIAELEEDIRVDNVLIKDPEFCTEAYTFIYDEQNRPVAMGKGTSTDSDDVVSDETYTDDDIMAKCITNHVRKTKQRGSIILPV